MSALKYANRALAVVYVLGWLAWATSVIGEPPSGKPVTWAAAWTFAWVIAVAMWIGWKAHAEQSKS